MNGSESKHDYLTHTRRCKILLRQANQPTELYTQIKNFAHYNLTDKCGQTTFFP